MLNLDALDGGSKPLAMVLRRGVNNLDLVRLLAATAVIYGHSFALYPHAGAEDVFYKFTGLYAAEWGVKTFFFLSGLLVVNSVLSDSNPLNYAIRRISRIWPALIFITCVTVFLIGPMVTTLSLSEYFSGSEVRVFLRRMILFDIWGHNNMSLPGLFATNPYPDVVNAPLWTLSVEAFAYVVRPAQHTNH